MDKELDERLGQALGDDGSIKHCCGQSGTNNITDDINQIKQAFKEAGYVNLSDRGGLIHTTVVDHRGRVEYMTGQEFYDRFWLEYELPEGRNSKFIDSTTVRKDIDLIVRRAAGLKESEG